jgi:polar amino acid transport system substrate-binding protein
VDADNLVHQVLPQATVMQVDTQANVIQALESRRVEGAAVDLSTVRWMVARDPGRYGDSGKAWSSQLYGAAMRQGDQDWLQFVNTALTVGMYGHQTQIYDDAFKQFFGLEPPPRKPGFPYV